MKQFTDALLNKVKKHHHTHEEKDGSTSEKKHHHKSKEAKESKHHHKHTSKNKDRQAPPTSDPLVVAAQPINIAAQPLIAATVVADQTPAILPSAPAKVSAPLVEQHSIVELLSEPNPEVASHAHKIIEKRQSAELIFSGVGTDAHGLHGRQAPPHSMTVTNSGIHYLTTDEAVAAMNQKEAKEQAKSKEIVMQHFEDEPLGKRVNSKPKQEEDEPLGKVVKRRNKI